MHTCASAHAPPCSTCPYTPAPSIVLTVLDTPHMAQAMSATTHLHPHHATDMQSHEGISQPICHGHCGGNVTRRKGTYLNTIINRSKDEILLAAVCSYEEATKVRFTCRPTSRKEGTHQASTTRLLVLLVSCSCTLSWPVPCLAPISLHLFI